MSNSSLICYTKLSPNCNVRKNSVYNPSGKISRITIHHMAGNCGIEALGSDFARPERAGSSNYGVGTDGRIAMYVPEDKRSWASSNRANDYVAVTIEVANNGGKPTWTVSDEALESTINLCVDICERNGIDKLTYTGKLEGSNLTRHDWFANTTCPGPYLGGKFPYIVEQVNKRLNKEEPVVEEVKTSFYRVRKCWDDKDSQIGAFTVLTNAKKCADKNEGYFVYDNDGNQVYPEIPEPEKIDNMSKFIWDFLKVKGLNEYAIAGIIGNLNAESALRSTNLQQTYEKSLGYTDDTYTRAVDSGKYKNFVNDKAGYGLAQWTYHTRKQKLLDFAKSEGKSIGSASMQMEFLWKELTGGYKSVLNKLNKVTSVREASNIMLFDFEAPANQDQSVQDKRAEYSEKYFDMYGTKVVKALRKGDKGDRVKELQNKLLKLGYTELGGADGSFGANTQKAVKLFQKNNGLEVDGIAGPKTQTAINELLNYSMKDFVKEVQVILNDFVDGVADAQTLAKTVTISSIKNKRHKVVKPIQKRLMAMGYTEVGKADGSAGAMFTSAVKRLQKERGKTVDGEITKKQYTWKLLLGMVK